MKQHSQGINIVGDLGCFHGDPSPLNSLYRMFTPAANKRRVKSRDTSVLRTKSENHASMVDDTKDYEDFEDPVDNANFLNKTG